MEDNRLIEKYINKTLTKLSNSSVIRSIYPMIDHIDVYDVQDIIDRIILKIYVGDSEMTHDNMYQKGLDPYYLVSYHLKGYLPYLGIKKDTRFGIVVVGPDGNVIFSNLG